MRSTHKRPNRTSKQRHQLQSRLYTTTASYSYTPSNMVSTFLRILNIIKLFHWKTKKYAAHKATDELYGDLSGRIDSFVEQLMGSDEHRIDIDESLSLAVNCYDVDELVRHIKTFKKYLEKYPALGSTRTYQFDLSTLKDEMIGIIDKFLYLSTLN